MAHRTATNGRQRRAKSPQKSPQASVCVRRVFRLPSRRGRAERWPESGRPFMRLAPKAVARHESRDGGTCRVPRQLRGQHGPVTIRGLYYQAEVARVPGIDKTENGYAKVQRQVLKCGGRSGCLIETSRTRPAGCANQPLTTALWTLCESGARPAAAPLVSP
jgi:hypothetical protein